MITRTDKLTSLTVNPLALTVDVQITKTFTDSADGTTVVTARGLGDAQASAAYNAPATQTFLAAALDYVNALRPANAPAVTLP